MSDAAQEERLIELETRLAYQDDLLDHLNKTLAEQQQELLELRTLCRKLLQQIRQAPEQATQWRAEDEVPPHY